MVVIEAAELPCMVFVNGLIKEERNVTKPLDELTGELGIVAVPLTVSIGSGPQMSTVADLLQNRVLTVRSDRPQAEEGPVPPSGSTGWRRPGGA